MIPMIAVGALTGGLLYVLVVTVAPPRPSPLALLGRFDAHWQADHPANTDPDPVRGWIDRVGAHLAAAATRRGIRFTSLRQDLALTGRTLPAALGRKVILGCTGFVAALVVIVLTQQIIGAALPTGAPILVALGVGAAGFHLPNVDARTQATRRRAEFRRGLGAYLDLVSLEMAGSAAPAEALPSAAKVGSGWPLALIRHTLYQATRAGRDQWEALADLGSRIGVTELRDLGELVALVAHDGARVRTTLTARAASMRQRELADLAGRSGKQDSSMRVAQVVIGLGFLVFLLYPALAAVQAF